MSDALRVAFRAYTVREPKKRRRQTSKRIALPNPGWGKGVLTLDFETTPDQLQRLIFGCFRYARWTKESKLTTATEGLVYAEDLPFRDPCGFGVLREYVKTHDADVVPGQRRELMLLSRTMFMKEVFWPAAYRARAIVAGFNLPFDLSRIATDARPAQGRFRGGFSFKIWPDYKDSVSGELREDVNRPRLVIKHLDSKRALMEFTARREHDAADLDENGDPFRGRFLDVRTIVFALTNESHSLDSACKMFEVAHPKTAIDQYGVINPDAISYNRRDVLATQEVLEKARAQFDHHPIDLDPCRTYSPASIAKAYFKAMGITEPRTRIFKMPRAALSAAMIGYYGGRAEARIRRIGVPIVCVDFKSMYPTVNIMMETSDIQNAQSIEIEDFTDGARSLLANVKIGDCFKKETWRKFRFFARVVPTKHVLPLRAKYGLGDAYNIGVNEVSSEEGIWYAGPDLVKAVILTGRPIKVLEAFAIRPVGVLNSLRPVKLRGSITVNPRTEDWFRATVEARRDPATVQEGPWQSEFLKVFSNSGSYGVNAELSPEELPKGKKETITVYGLDGPFESPSRAPEQPGRYFFPPLAALTTAGARLMLGLLERCVTDAGGAYAFCDTDSMAIVSTQTGGSVAAGLMALSWKQVEEIVERFASLNPYDPARVPGSILKIEKENFLDGQQTLLYAYVISAKRYAVYNLHADGTYTLRKWSEHGLGHLRNPIDPESESRDWVKQIWELIIAESLGLPVVYPNWLDRPALSRVTVTSPNILWPLRKKKVPYPESVKPYNFVLVAHVARYGQPLDCEHDHFLPIAQYEKDARKWIGLDWTDIYSGNKYGISTRGLPGKTIARVKSYRDVLADYRTHPESKSADADGNPCSRSTIGVLQRRHIRVEKDLISYTGKESNRYEEKQSELDIESGEEHVDPRSDTVKQNVFPILREEGAKNVAGRINVSAREVYRLLKGERNPSAETARKMIRAGAEIARDKLQGDVPDDDLAACVAYARWRKSSTDRHRK